MAYSIPLDYLNEEYFEEGQQAEEYKARKAKEAQDEKDRIESEYQKRYGSVKSITTLRGKDRKPGVEWDRVTHGSPDHSNVRNANMSADQKQAHLDKMNRDRDIANIAGAKIQQKRAHQKNSGNLDNSAPEEEHYMRTTARTADAIAKHNRRHPDRKLESFSLFENVLFI